VDVHTHTHTHTHTHRHTHTHTHTYQTGGEGGGVSEAFYSSLQTQGQAEVLISHIAFAHSQILSSYQPVDGWFDIIIIILC